MFKTPFVLIAFGLITNTSVIASSDNSPNTFADQTDTKLSTTQGVPKPLQGGVEKIELSVDQIQDVGLDLKTALRAANSVYEEVTRQPVRIITQPEPLPNGTIINIPVGTEPTGPPAPARKAYLDAAMNKMKPIVDTLKKNVDEYISGKKQLDVSADTMIKIQPQVQNWIKTVNIVAFKVRQLEQITYAPPYDNRTIAALASLIVDGIKDLDRTRLEVYKVIRKQGKRHNASA